MEFKINFMEKTRKTTIPDDQIEKITTKSKFRSEKKEEKSGENLKEKLNEKSKSKKTKKVEYQDKFPKNINEYRHIIDTLKINDKELEWVLELRNCKKYSNEYPKVISSNAPNLKNLEPIPKKKIIDIDYKGSTNNIDHIVRSKIGTNFDLTQAKFQVNLRNYKPNKGFENNDWNSTSYSNKNKTMTEFIPPMLKTNIKAFSKLDGLVPKPQETNFSNIDYLNRKTLLRMVKPKVTTGDFLGEHYGMPKYDLNYYNPNFNSIREIVSNTANNSTSKWSLGLRGGSIVDLKKNITKGKKTIKENNKNSEGKSNEINNE